MSCTKGQLCVSSLLGRARACVFHVAPLEVACSSASSFSVMSGISSACLVPERSILPDWSVHAWLRRGTPEREFESFLRAGKGGEGRRGLPFPPPNSLVSLRSAFSCPLTLLAGRSQSPSSDDPAAKPTCDKPSQFSRSPSAVLPRRPQQEPLPSTFDSRRPW